MFSLYDICKTFLQLHSLNRVMNEQFKKHNVLNLEHNLKKYNVTLNQTLTKS